MGWIILLIPLNYKQNARSLIKENIATLIHHPQPTPEEIVGAGHMQNARSRPETPIINKKNPGQ